MTFTEETIQLVSAVFGPISTEHGISDETIAIAEKRLALKLPDILCDYYRITGKQKQVSDGMDHLFGPSDLSISNGALVFGEENQAVFSAGILLPDLDKADPPVMYNCDDDGVWELASSQLSRYFLVTFCWQACNALPSVAQAQITPDQLRRLQGEYRWTSFTAHEKDVTIGLWGHQMAIVVFSKSNDAYIACHEDRQLETFEEKWQIPISHC